MKYERHDNNASEVDEDELYRIDKMSLYDKKLRKRAFEKELERRYNIII